MGGFGLRIPAKTTSKPKATGLFENSRKAAPEREDNTTRPLPTTSLVEQAKNEALEEDPSAFDYDEVFESVSSSARHRAKLVSSKTEGPRYMPAIIEAAEARKRELELSRVRKYRKEDAQEQGEQVFMTAGYKKKLEEMKQKGLDPDKPIEEEKDGREMSKFYSNLMKKNISFGGRERSPERRP
ncbi:hypothetical protein PSACC_01879 [Paramicrosporidium saccamoebae]|uniref:Nuclear speckle splicing regulatory protein 1 N-terminal domain-containing protein n=1 Tax=Paramicrosporidium saccamoebae TaxID=1246581 RepID=A0A2H9TKR6_9FUNG|nr:hypothetical protein PSACC_01879 [Paramicrosporidium saccamoebae]